MAGNPRLLPGQLRAFCGGLKANVVQTEPLTLLRGGGGSSCLQTSLLD